MTHKKTSFQQLQDKWYAKLKDSGFDDAEDRAGRLKYWVLDLHQFDSLRDSSKEEYYRLAGHFLHDFKFDSKLDYRIWELHAEGLHLKAIKLKLFEDGFITRVTYVKKTLKRLKKTMLDNWRSNGNP